MHVKVLGTGCAKCKQLNKKVNEFKKTIGNLEVEYISDISEIMKFGVMSVPVLVIDDEVKVVGRVPNDKELTKLLQNSTETVT